MPLHSKMDGATRFAIGRRFNDRHQDGPRVLILTYAISSAGVNFQGDCRNSHHFTQPPLQSQNDQAKERLRRIGQTKTVKIYNYVLENSHDTYMTLRDLEKATPITSLFYNVDALGGTITNIGTVYVPPFVRNQDDTLSELRTPFARYFQSSLVGFDGILKGFLMCPWRHTRLHPTKDAVSDCVLAWLEEKAAKPNETPPRICHQFGRREFPGGLSQFEPLTLRQPYSPKTAKPRASAAHRPDENRQDLQLRS